MTYPKFRIGLSLKDVLRLGAFAVILAIVANAGNAQTITGSVTTVERPNQVVANPVTNKIYVGNTGQLTVVDGATGQATTLQGLLGSDALAINTSTNKIYGLGTNGISVIDGATNAVITVPATYLQSLAINSVTNKIYGANSQGNSVAVLDGSTNTLSSISVNASPVSLAINPVTNKIYVSSGTSSITVIDGFSNSTTSVPIGAASNSVAINPLNNKIYFSTNGGVVVLDGTTNSTSTLPVSYISGPLAINPLTNKLYTLYGPYEIAVIDAGTGKTDLLNLGAVLESIAVNPTTNKIYVAGVVDIFVLDGNTDSVSALTTSVSQTVAVNPVTNRIYVANSGFSGPADCAVPGVCNTLTFVDGAMPLATTVALGAAPAAIALNTATNKSYVLNSAANSVTAIDGSTQNTTNIPVGTNPVALTTNPITNKAYVANQGSNSISVVDGSTNAAVTVPIGAQPGAISANPVTNKIYVANPSAAAGQITVLDGATNTASSLALGTAASRDLAINPATNKVYVETATSVVVVDGATNALVTVPLSIGTGLPLGGISVNPVTNKIYVVSGTSMTVIDGIANTTLNIPLSIGTAQYIQVNAITNKIYVAGTGSAVAVIDGSTNTPTLITTASPASGLFVNSVTNKIYALTGATVTVIDGLFNSASTLPLSAAGTGLAGNPNTDQIYVSLGSTNSVAIINEQQQQPNPLTVSITPLAGNQTTSATPSFTFTALSTTVSAPIAVYYQMDTQQTAWTAATGSNPSFAATLATLQPGVHTLYAYATDALASTLAYPFTPMVGSVHTYTFLMAPAVTTGGGGGSGTTSTTAFLTGQTPGALRNNYSGFVGFAFTVGSSALQVSSLGRYAAPGNTGSHLLKLVTSNGTDVSGGSVTVAMSGTTTGQYQYGTLSSPVTLAANTNYYLLSAETAGGDQWYDIGGVTSTNDASVTAPVYSYGSSSYYAVPGLTGKAYVPVNFQFTTTTAVTPPPVNPPTTSGTSFVTAQTPGALRNNYSGAVGFSFTPSSAITLTSLGRYVAPGNSGTHLLQIVSVGNATVVASALLSLTGATAGQFSYAALSASVTLQANATYYLTSQETAGGDSWYDIGPLSVTSVASVSGPVYTYGSGSYYPVPGLPGQSYAPVSFQYQMSNTTPVTPVTTGTALFTGQTLGAQRNNYSGFVGTAIQVGSTPLTVTSLGRFVAAGNNGTHTLKLVQANGTDLAVGSVTVNVANGIAGQYTYAALATPVTLQANTSYYLLSQETGGADFWYDLGPVTSTGAVQVTGGVYSYGQTNYFLVPGSAGYSYVPVNLLYQ